MASAVLTSLSLVFMVAGLTLLVASVALSRRTRRYRSGMQALMQLGALRLEPLDIPAAAWPILARAGWQHLALTGNWFGHTVNSTLGDPQHAPTSLDQAGSLEFQINSGDDVSLALRLTHQPQGGDEWLFAESLARVFVLLLETGLRARTEALSVALAERARLTLYLQHDMRNLAQWVGWICTDFSDCPDAPSLLTLARRLQENAPLAQERAQHLMAALGQNPVNDLPAQVDLRLAITEAARLAGIDIHVSGQAQAWMARGLLARVFDNLFSNLAPNWRNPVAERPSIQLKNVQASVCAPAMAEINFHSPWPEPGAPIASEKLFEPFSSGRPGGLGLGLYQARKSLCEAGGELRAAPTATGLSFLLRMPSRVP